MSRFFAPLAFLLVVALPAEAQQFGRVQDIQNVGGAYFVHVMPGRPSTQVQVWGTVGQPGLYEVEQDTDLGKLLTLAGGPPLPVMEPRDTREVTVRLYRGSTGARALLFEASLEGFVTQPGRYPTLQDGDFIMVETRFRRGWNWRDTIAVVGAVGTVTTVALNIYSIATR